MENKLNWREEPDDNFKVPKKKNTVVNTLKGITNIFVKSKKPVTKSELNQALLNVDSDVDTDEEIKALSLNDKTVIKRIKERRESLQKLDENLGLGLGLKLSGSNSNDCIDCAEFDYNMDNQREETTINKSKPKQGNKPSNLEYIDKNEISQQKVSPSEVLDQENINKQVYFMTFPNLKSLPQEQVKPESFLNEINEIVNIKNTSENLNVKTSTSYTSDVETRKQYLHQITDKDTNKTNQLQDKDSIVYKNYRIPKKRNTLEK
uniref:Uncharacterized protein n=3 Tax=Clastoptera arizonana TaxID=38151 RepID=A0A1B6CUE4_9HEMI